jgi:hypothetical protein
MGNMAQIHHDACVAANAKVKQVLDGLLRLHLTGMERAALLESLLQRLASSIKPRHVVIVDH